MGVVDKPPYVISDSIPERGVMSNEEIKYQIGKMSQAERNDLSNDVLENVFETSGKTFSGAIELRNFIETKGIPAERLQEYLQYKGYYTGKIDGVIGNGSFRAFTKKFPQLIEKESMKDHTSNLTDKEVQEILARAPEKVKNLVRKYFPAHEYINALIVCDGESSFNLNAVNENDDKYKSIDRGLFQINDHWNSDKYKGRNIFDPEVNVEVASKIYKEAGNKWNRWYAAKVRGLWI